jgi:hypothetical protein
VQDELVSALYLAVATDVDQVAILAIHCQGREIAGSCLHWLVASLMLAPLLFAARANAEGPDVELQDVL